MSTGSAAAVAPAAVAPAAVAPAAVAPAAAVQAALPVAPAAVAPAAVAPAAVAPAAVAQVPDFKVPYWLHSFIFLSALFGLINCSIFLSKLDKDKDTKLMGFVGFNLAVHIIVIMIYIYRLFTV
jgi:hypothetical protein